MDQATSRRRDGAGSGDSMGAYLRGLRDPIMSREEERDVAVQFRQTGDPDFATRLVRANLRLVVKIALEFRRAHREVLDLVQEGNIGLIHAVQKFDPRRGVKLASYATWWIRAYIFRFILANKALVKIGTTTRQKRLFFNLRRVETKLQQRRETIEAADLARELDVEEQDVIEMQQRLAGAEVSFDSPSYVGAQTSTIGGKLGADASGRPDLMVEAHLSGLIFQEHLRAFGETLQGRELAIFRDRLLHNKPASLRELGERFGVTRERMRQLERDLKLRLRRALEADLGHDLELSDLAA